MMIENVTAASFTIEPTVNNSPLFGLLLLDQKFLLDLCLNAGPTVRNQEAAVGLHFIFYSWNSSFLVETSPLDGGNEVVSSG
jgi:hypothetical protein